MWVDHRSALELTGWTVTRSLSTRDRRRRAVRFDRGWRGSTDAVTRYSRFGTGSTHRSSSQEIGGVVYTPYEVGIRRARCPISTNAAYQYSGRRFLSHSSRSFTGLRRLSKAVSVPQPAIRENRLSDRIAAFREVGTTRRCLGVRRDGTRSDTSSRTVALSLEAVRRKRRVTSQVSQTGHSADLATRWLEGVETAPAVSRTPTRSSSRRTRRALAAHQTRFRSRCRDRRRDRSSDASIVRTTRYRVFDPV